MEPGVDGVEEVEAVDSLEESAAAPGEEPPPSQRPKIVDKRRFARLLGLAPGDSDPATRERLPTYVAELKERAEAAEARARAEVEAARARLERHYEARLASARAELVERLLGVLDNLDRALALPEGRESPLYEGVGATRDLFLRTLGEMGAEAVVAVGERFDPEVHEAVDEVDVEDPALGGAVVVEVRRGFRIGERLIRPAVVRVGRARAGSAEPE